MPWVPTTEQILNLDGVRRRADGFRFELLDQAGEVIGNLSPDRDRPPQVSNDTGRTIHRTLTSFHLPASEQTDVNVVSDRVRPWMVLQDSAEFMLGTFLWGDDSRPYRGWGPERYSSLVDRTRQLNTRMPGSLGWPVQSPSGIIFVFLAFQAGLTLDDLGASSDSDVPLAEPVAWSPGTTWLSAMEDLADQVGIATPWFDRFDKLTFLPVPDPAETEPTLRYDLGTRIIANSITHSDDLLEAPNYFVAYGTGPKNSVRGTFSLPSSAPHSEANRGFRDAFVEGMQSLGSNAQARNAARALSRTKGQAFEWVQFESSADPRHDTWDVIAAPDKDGESANWLEVSWAITCRSGAPMTHVARKVYGT